MNKVAIPLKIISLLANGNVYSRKKFSSILKIKYEDINQYIQTVCCWGVDVLIIPNKGYCLYKPLQLLDKTIIYAHLQYGRLEVLSIVDSTNQYLIDRIDTLESGDACVAEYQAKGRGLHGRHWISPFGKNLYLSLYWSLRHGLLVTSNLSIMISILIAESLKSLGVKGIQIKWPNDIYLHNRKLAGVLVEINSKNRDVAHIVLGIGINLTKYISKKENNSWINLQEVGIIINRNVFIAKIVNTLRQAMRQFEIRGVIPFINY